MDRKCTEVATSQGDSKQFVTDKNGNFSITGLKAFPTNGWIKIKVQKMDTQGLKK